MSNILSLADRSDSRKGDMTPEAEALQKYMIDISENAYCAHWMEDLAYVLWGMVLNGPARYGRIDITPIQVDQLKSLSEKCGGWVDFERFISLEDWEHVYEQHRIS